MEPDLLSTELRSCDRTLLAHLRCRDFAVLEATFPNC